jgi:hypothetical protein
MGCDYYIDKTLYIFYHNENNSNSDFSTIELSHDKGYFYYPNLDEDDIDYDKIIEKSINDQLTSNMKPIILYSNNVFTDVKYEKKYKTLIESNMTKGKKWEDIKEIKKKESRYERD